LHDPNHGEFKHIHFKRGHPELLPLIKRKAHVKNPNATSAAGGPSKAQTAKDGECTGREIPRTVIVSRRGCCIGAMDYPLDDDEFFASAALDPIINDPALAGNLFGSPLAAPLSGPPVGTIPIQKEDLQYNLDAIMAELSHQQVSIWHLFLLALQVNMR
jgi:hypothetical protein